MPLEKDFWFAVYQKTLSATFHFVYSFHRGEFKIKTFSKIFQILLAEKKIVRLEDLTALIQQYLPGFHT